MSKHQLEDKQQRAAQKMQRRKLHRRAAIALMYGMCETDTSFEDIAKATGLKQSTVETYILDMLRGDEKLNMNVVSDLANAMNCDLTIAIHPLDEQQIEQPAEAPTEETRVPEPA